VSYENNAPTGVRPGEPLLVTVREAARLLALGRSTVYELIARGQLPTVHIGRSVRIRVADLETLVAQKGSDQPQSCA
jgi:excisionase family DNA binding protein